MLARARRSARQGWTGCWSSIRCPCTGSSALKPRAIIPSSASCCRRSPTSSSCSRACRTAVRSSKTPWRMRSSGVVAPGRSELEIAAAVYQTLLASGSSLPASAINLVTGERCGFAHGAPTLRRLQRGDPGNVEFGAAYKRYTKTIGRQFNLGPPSSRVRDLYAVVRAAFDACLAEIRDGIPAIVPHEAAKRVIAEAGMDGYRLHTTGYSIGAGVPPSWGEPLNMFGGSKDVLRAGMVVSIEPPVFSAEERLGARIIDNVLVTESGAELLSTYLLDLLVVD